MNISKGLRPRIAFIWIVFVHMLYLQYFIYTFLQSFFLSKKGILFIESFPLLKKLLGGLYGVE